MKINFTVRQTSTSGFGDNPKRTVHVHLALIPDGRSYPAATLFFQAQASRNREDIPALGSLYLDGLDLEESLKDFFFGPFRWDGATIDNLGGLIAQNTDWFAKLLKAWQRRVIDANLYHRHGADDLAVWIDALQRMKATQVNSEYDQTPVAIAAAAK